MCVMRFFLRGFVSQYPRLAVARVHGGVLQGLRARVGARPAAGEEAPSPKWMSALATFTPVKCLGLGVTFSSVKPKNLVLTIAAATAISESGIPVAQEAVELAHQPAGGLVLHRPERRHHRLDPGDEEGAEQAVDPFPPGNGAGARNSNGERPLDGPRFRRKD